jgi:RsiW-degrading membrane proteinase PrsW (M82 family)
MNPDHQPSPWILVLKVITAICLVLAALAAGTVGICFAIIAHMDPSDRSPWSVLVIAMITLVLAGVLLVSAVLVFVSKRRSPRK